MKRNKYVDMGRVEYVLAELRFRFWMLRSRFWMWILAERHGLNGLGLKIARDMKKGMA